LELNFVLVPSWLLRFSAWLNALWLAVSGLAEIASRLTSKRTVTGVASKHHKCSSHDPPIKKMCWQ